MKVSLIIALMLSAPGAQAFELPRAPLLKGVVPQMLPPEMRPGASKDRQVPATVQAPALSPAVSAPQPVPPGSIRLRNIGTANLAVSYLDAGKQWHTVSVPSGGAVPISCASCGPDFELAFHNGREMRRFAARAGNEYVLSWTGSVWDILGNQSTAR